MISALSELDKRSAIGVLARAALASEDETNPDAAFQLPNERSLRNSIFFEVSLKSHISLEDNSTDAAERLGEAIDAEIDSLAGVSDEQAILQELALKGDLPADLYQVQIIPNVRELYEKNWSEEESFILKAIYNADSEQHFGVDVQKTRPALVSLFAKHFSDRFPARSFTLLVVAVRDGLLLTVQQSWRLYADTISLIGIVDLLAMLRRFVDKFGMNFSFNDVKTKFLLKTELSEYETRNWSIETLPIEGVDGRGRRTQRMPKTYVSHFFTRDSAGNFLSNLAVAINLEDYQDYLESHNWKQADII